MGKRQEQPIRFFALASRLRSDVDVTSLLRILMGHGGGLTPTVFGYCEPLRSKIDASRPHEVGKNFSQGDMLTIRAPSASLTLSCHSANYRFGTLDLCVARSALPSAQLSELVCQIAALLQPELGFVHLLNDHDRARDIRRGLRVDAADAPAFGIFHTSLMFGLPDFYWGMVFGKPYLSLLGEQKVKQVPAWRVESPADDVVYVQLTENIGDCWDNPQKMSQARKAGKEHLGETAFMHDKLAQDDLGNLELPLLTRLFARKRIVPSLIP
jgi:hypothetical protein